MLKVVVDTNVLISALHKHSSNPAFALSLVLNRQILLCLTKEIFDEYQGVLNRKKFNYLNKNLVNELLDQIKNGAVWVVPKAQLTILKRDPADNRFLECAMTAQADFLITGNTKHFPLRNFHNTRILTPNEFIKVIASEFL